MSASVKAYLALKLTGEDPEATENLAIRAAGLIQFGT